MRKLQKCYGNGSLERILTLGIRQAAAIVQALLLSTWMAFAIAGDQTEPSAQSTGSGKATGRAESWRQQRLAKLHHPPPAEKENRIQEGLIWLEAEGLQRILGFNVKRFYPAWGADLPRGSGLAFGTLYRHPNIADRWLDFESGAVLSTQGYRQWQLRLGEVYPRWQPFSLFGEIRLDDFPREDFFGVGPDSAEGARSDFTLQQSAFDAVFGHQIHRRLRADVRLGFSRFDIERGRDSDTSDVHDVFDEETAPGLTSQPDFVRLSGKLAVDFRDRPGNPHSGTYAAFEMGRWDGLGGGSFDFNRYALDVRQYIELGSLARVLALRFWTSTDSTGQGARVPFYLQKTLGGWEGLRGYRDFRFRDRNQLALSAEYRWEAASFLEFALLYDAGKVFAERADFDLSDLRYSRGFGVRFKTPEAVVVSFEAARSDEGMRFYFRFAPLL